MRLSGAQAAQSCTTRHCTTSLSPASCGRSAWGVRASCLFFPCLIVVRFHPVISCVLIYFAFILFSRLKISSPRGRKQWEKVLLKDSRSTHPVFSLQPNMYGCFTNHTFFLLYHPFSQRFLLYHPPKPHYPHIKLFPFQLPYLPSNLFSFQLGGGSKSQSHHRGTVAEENIFTAAPSIFLGVRWDGSGGSGVPWAGVQPAEATVRESQHMCINYAPGAPRCLSCRRRGIALRRGMHPNCANSLVYNIAPPISSGRVSKKKYVALSLR